MICRTIVSALKPFGEAIVELVVASTYNWYWFVDGLMGAGYAIHLANTAAIVQYAGLKYSDDESDARWLAKLLRLGRCPRATSTPRRRCQKILQSLW